MTFVVAEGTAERQLFATLVAGSTNAKLPIGSLQSTAGVLASHTADNAAAAGSQRVHARPTVQATWTTALRGRW
jgi:hypothetical protein